MESRFWTQPLRITIQSINIELSCFIVHISPHYRLTYEAKILTFAIKKLKNIYYIETNIDFPELILFSVDIFLTVTHRHDITYLLTPSLTSSFYKHVNYTPFH